MQRDVIAVIEAKYRLGGYLPRRWAQGHGLYTGVLHYFRKAAISSKALCGKARGSAHHPAKAELCRECCMAVARREAYDGDV